MPIRTCPCCNREFFTNDQPPIICAKCGSGLSLSGDSLVKSQDEPDRFAQQQSIILTTSYLVAGRDIERELDVITAECVFGVNVIRDLFASARDLFGGRSASLQDVLRDARRTVLTELRAEASRLGADAVIAIELDYQQISGGGTMLMLVASGTAVKLRSVAHADAQ